MDFAASKSDEAVTRNEGGFIKVFCSVVAIGTDAILRRLSTIFPPPTPTPLLDEDAATLADETN